MSYTVLQCPVLTAKERPHRRFSQPMKALFKLFRRFDARRIFGFIRRLGGMSRPKVKCYDLRSTRALRVEGDLNISDLQMSYITFLSTPSGWRPSFPSDMECRFWNFYPRPPGGGRQQKRTKFSSVFAQKGEEFASLRRGKRKICRWRFKKDKFWVLIWCEGSGKSVCALASHFG